MSNTVLISWIRRLAETNPAQRDSGISKLRVGVLGILGRKTKSKNNPAQRRSKMSNGRMSGVSCWPHRQNIESRPAQRDSIMSNLGMGVMRVIGVMGVMWKGHTIKDSPVQQDSKISNLKVETEKRPAQRDSGIYNLAYRPFCPYCPSDLKTAPAQQDSRMSNLGMGLLRPMRPMRPIGLMGQKCAPAQRDSEISNLKNSPALRDSPANAGPNLGLGVLGMLRILGRKTKSKNASAQADSGMSILKTSPTVLLAVRLVPQSGDPYSPLIFKTSPAQQDSRMSNLGMGLMRPIGLMGQKCAPAQRDSGISNLKTSPAQRDSGIYKLVLSLYIHALVFKAVTGLPGTICNTS